jgi:hypothetical protein
LIALHRRHVFLDGREFVEDGIQSGLDIITHGKREDRETLDTR